MSQDNHYQNDQLYTERKKFRVQKRKVYRRNALFVSTLAALVCCTIVIGALYIVRYSPDHCFIVMRDRKAPIVNVHDEVSANGKVYQISDFVDDVQDISDVEMAYIQAPDYDTDGVQDVVIRFTDEAGNYTDKTLKLDVYHDTSAPVIYGEEDVWVYWNESISYKSLVEVWDDYDEECELDIDNSQVNIMEIGDYDVVYTATDSSGNAATKNITIHVMEPDTDEYYLMKANELCDKIIAQYITDDMDKLHQVWAVYEYVKTIPYILTDYTRNYIREGYKMLSNLSGDCYGSYSAVRLLLERLGIDCIPVEADESWGNKHFWNLVSIDGGVTWYHVDATNWVEWGYQPIMCMISDTRLSEISARHHGTHIYIQEDYPTTPYESMPVPEDLVLKYDLNLWEPY